MQWYYQKDDGSQGGPIEDSEFKHMVRIGNIKASTLVWNESMTDWVAYSTLGEPAPPISEDRTIVQPSTPQQAAPQDSTRPAVQGASQPAAAAAASPSSHKNCCQCGNQFLVQDMIAYEDRHVCAGCKAVFFQSLREGASNLDGEMEYAGFWVRFLAKIIDGLILGAFAFISIFILMLVVIAVLGQDSDLAIAIQALANFVGVAMNICYTTFFIGKYDATPGKMAMGLKVVTDANEKVSFGRALGRGFAEILSGCVCYIGYIMAGFDQEKRTLHDIICTTRVIRK